MPWQSRFWDAPWIHLGYNRVAQGMRQGYTRNKLGILGILQGCNRDALGIHWGYTKDAIGVQQGSNRDAMVMQQGCNRDAKGCNRDALGIRQEYTRNTLKIHQGYSRDALGRAAQKSKLPGSVDLEAQYFLRDFATEFFSPFNIIRVLELFDC